MATYTIHAAKTNLSKLVSRAERGEEIVLARGRDAVAKIVPVTPKPKRKFGRLKGKIKVGPEFFEPLPEEELKLWEGR
jgi:antitoxin (DNA-binding transcriptional repressor) of toxin-antitoxin stability system